MPFLFLIITGCKQQEINRGHISNSQTIIAQNIDVPGHLQNWANSINKNNVDSTKSLYDANSVKIISPDNIIESSGQIADYYSAQKDKITSIKSLFSVEADGKRKINYELISYRTGNRKEFIAIVIWRIENKKIVREFEFSKQSSLGAKKGGHHNYI